MGKFLIDIFDDRLMMVHRTAAGLALAQVYDLVDTMLIVLAEDRSELILMARSPNTWMARVVDI